MLVAAVETEERPATTTREEVLPPVTEDPRYIGHNAERPSARRLVQGQGQYLDDIELPRLAHVVFWRSPVAHCRILRIDADAARRMPGVLLVADGKDIATVCKPWVATLAHLAGMKSAPQYPLAIDRACWQGEPVVAIVAETREQAEDALQLVQVDFERLPPVVDMETALDTATPVIHPELGDNLCFTRDLAVGDVDAAFARADAVVEATFEFGRHTGVTLEPRSQVADWNAAEQRLTVYHSFQAPHMMQDLYSRQFDIPESAVRVICRDVGGSFGIKVHAYPDDFATVALSMLCRRPVKFVADRLESFTSDIHARHHRIKGRIAANRDGEILAFAIDDLTGIGPYSMFPRTSAIEGNQVVNLVGGPYKHQHYRAHLDVVFQNKTPTCQYRGVGHPIACAVTEGLVDLAARKIGMDALELRRRNVIPDDAYPATGASGIKLEQLSHEACLRKIEQLMDYPALLAEQKAIAGAGHPPRHRFRDAHRAHQSQRRVLWRGGRPHRLAGRRHDAARSVGRGHRHGRRGRTGPGQRRHLPADRGRRGRRRPADGARGHRRHRRHALRRRHLGLARRGHRRRGRAAGGPGVARQHPEGGGHPAEARRGRPGRAARRDHRPRDQPVGPAAHRVGPGRLLPLRHACRPTSRPS
jgi:carbon-monoxide dehydrogenase large subunit